MNITSSKYPELVTSKNCYLFGLEGNLNDSLCACVKAVM